MPIIVEIRAAGGGLDAKVFVAEISNAYLAMISAEN